MCVMRQNSCSGATIKHMQFLEFTIIRNVIPLHLCSFTDANLALRIKFEVGLGHRCRLSSADQLFVKRS